MGDRYEAWKSEPVCNPLWIFVEMQLRYWNLLDPNCIGSNRIINTDSFPYQTSMKKRLCAFMRMPILMPSSWASLYFLRTLYLVETLTH